VGSASRRRHITARQAGARLRAERPSEYARPTFLTSRCVRGRERELKKERSGQAVGRLERALGSVRRAAAAITRRSQIRLARRIAPQGPRGRRLARPCLEDALPPGDARSVALGPCRLNMLARAGFAGRSRASELHSLAEADMHWLPTLQHRAAGPCALGHPHRAANSLHGPLRSRRTLY
jgi:hypothetical protein